MKHRKVKNTSRMRIVLISSALFFALFVLTAVLADTAVHEINNFDELMEAAAISRETGHSKDKYVLKNDIEITEADQEKLVASDLKYISFGSSDNPFAGTFDGEGHSISNLKYSSTLKVIPDSGLFSSTTTGAIIKNLTIKNADIQSDYRGGLIAGYAEGTTFENITVEDSHLFVSAIDNVITLITDGGIRGGAIVGEADNCILYNCESTGTTVNTNNTSGVAALYGKGLYLGGLIGTSINTEVEYSRVKGGVVKNYYDVAVGALGGNTVYCGGIIGQMKNGSKVIDSFSTAELYYYTATYVSVGAGNVGHIGGIAAAMYGDRNEIQRCHYAGKATSRQYNAVLVVPIVQDNLNISGIADVYEGGSVVNTYFKSSLNPDVNMKVLGSTATTSSYGPLSNETYIDKDYWETQNFDFYGNKKRQSSYNNNHNNKWIMDYEQGIPVHGHSVSATLDFKGAGEVSIDKTELVKDAVSTKNPYSFAVQGMTTDEHNATIRATVKEGYRLISWYKIPKVAASGVEEDHSYFEEIFKNNTAISNNTELEDAEVEDNDLFVAYYQAQVLFHDIDGNILDKNTGSPVTESTNNDWYDYGASLPKVTPTNKPTSENASLIGWTTMKSNESGGGYSSITASELTKLKNNKAFYEPGEDITKAMKLYPVYKDLISNITTIFEGNEQDNVNDVSKRNNVGYTSAKMNEDGNVVISVKGVREDGSFPSGFRFIGWYNSDDIKVSKDTDYVLKDVDLTEPHTYTARFEYRVDYYSTTLDKVDATIDNSPYASVWHTYKEGFNELTDAPVDGSYTFSHWATDSKDNCNSDACSTRVSSSHEVVMPMTVYAHVNGSTLHDILLKTDFPNAGVLSNSNSPAGSSFTITAEPKTGYNFLFWGVEANNGGQWASLDAEWKAGAHLSTRKYLYEAHFNADVNFYDKEGKQKAYVTRHYNEKLFHSGETHTYQYPITGTQIEGEAYIDESKASPTENEMKVDGYVFLGWISSTEVVKNSTEWNYIYDVENEPYCTSNISKVKPYLLQEDTKVEETMDVYPVYAKWDITATTSVSYGNVATSVNIPSDPQYTITEKANEKGVGTVTITPDIDTYVMGKSGQKYTLTSLVRVHEDGTEEKLTASSNNTYEYSVEAGPTYTFVANYEPLVLAYHLNDSDINVSVREKGETVGTTPLPTYNNNEIKDDYIFVGWTTSEPTDKGYHTFRANAELEDSDISLISSSTMINSSMELWPVYVAMRIKVVSNIDTYLTANNIDLDEVRYITKPEVNNSQLNASTDKVENYEFVGWYKNYVSEANKGELITNNTTYILQDKESVENDTYTAVYKKVYQVNYFNTKGEIIYSAGVYQDESRTFVKEVTGINGDKLTIPIDSEAYDRINQSLEGNELFQNWQWQQNNGTIQEWNAFYNNVISQDMNLYPIIRKVSVKDSMGNEIDVVGSDNKEEDVLLTANKEKVDAFLNTEYTQPRLTVHVEDMYYKANNEYDAEAIDGVEVRVFKDTDNSKNPIATDSTNQNGDVTVNFYGEITITRNSTEESAKNDLFIFKILDENKNVINEVLLSQGESKTIKIPYGTYKVIQKKDWAWRYINGLSEDVNIHNKNTNVSVIYEEKRGINKWFDSMTRIDNEY